MSRSSNIQGKKLFFTEFQVSLGGSIGNVLSFSCVTADSILTKVSGFVTVREKIQGRLLSGENTMVMCPVMCLGAGI